MDKKEIHRRRRGIYLLPNLFTTAGLFAGFYAITSALGGKFELAAITIFIAIVMDSLDGRIARITNTQSDFGAEFDSLADMVSFGLAPALIMFEWALFDINKFGWFAAFLYVAAAALRLARFNTQVGVADKRYFQGLPSPAAAAFLTGVVWLGVELEIKGVSLDWGALVTTIIAGLLMVSNIRYSSFKEVNFKGKVPFMAMLIVTFVFALISINPAIVLFVMVTLYVISGPIMTLYQVHQKRKLKVRKKGLRG